MEPISLTEAKLHLRVDSTDEDTLISSLITSARVHIETALGRALITQTWSLFLDAWPAEPLITLFRVPVQSITEIKTFDAADAATVFDSANYYVDTVCEPARILLKNGAIWPVPGRVANGIEIGFQAGYGAAPSDVPEPFRQAILLLVAHWFEAREAVSFDMRPVEVPVTVMHLIGPYRRVQL